MEELLNNPLIQAAIVTVIVTAMNAVVALIKQKFPTQAALVESNWCYLQPVVEAAIAKAKDCHAAAGFTNSDVSAIITKALSDFAESYKTLEGKPASPDEIAAARAEISGAVAKTLEG
jgi:hypothetical protein